MSRVWPGPDGDVRSDDDARADLALAVALVPLVAGVAVAAGLLPWGARVPLGLALVVLGLDARRLAGAAFAGGPGRAARLQALGSGTVVGGLAVVAAAVALGVDGGSLKPVAGADLSSYAGVFGGPYGGLLRPVLGLTLLVGGAWALRADARAPGGRSAGPPGAITSATAGAGGALLLFAGTGPGALGIGTDVRVLLLLAVAAATTAVVVRGRGQSTWTRAAGFGAGLLAVLVVGDGTSLVGTVAGALTNDARSSDPSGVVRGLTVLVVSATAATLSALAVHRRDALLGVLPVGLLLDSPPIRGVPAGAGALLVPVLVAAAMVVTSRGRGPLVGRLTPSTALVVLAATLLIGVAAARGLVTEGAALVAFGDLDEVDVPRLVSASSVAVAVLGLLALTATSVIRRWPASHTAALALMTILGLYFLHPAWTLEQEIRDPFSGGRGYQAGALLLELASAAMLVALRRTPLVLAGGALVLADVLGHLGDLVLHGDGTGPPGALTSVLVVLGPAAVLLLVTAGVALFGSTSVTRAAQAAATAFGVALALSVSSGAGILADGITNDEGVRVGAALTGAQPAIAAVLVCVVLTGTGLLAASTVRRASGPAAGVAVLLAVLAGMLAAGVDVGARRSAEDGGSPSPEDVLLGFRTAGSSVQDAGGLLPAGLAVIAVLVLVAARWHGSRGPGPAEHRDAGASA
ncbi:hypothetical protein [Patulibacter minatonensis]|uniref:hypothetical protein n=1 Tax=Patulibacter minatonensis TaxID=298163 RepID=UPI00047C450E|nr:hypothetical protein [Patulibacter minatonensis]